MDLAAAAVAVGFGLLMGWGLGDRAYPHRPITATLSVGAALGGAVLIASSGSLAGWSLLLGCGGALATAHLRAGR